MVIWCKSGGGLGYLFVQEWAVLLLSLALAPVREFMVTELQWLTLDAHWMLPCEIMQKFHFIDLLMTQYVYCMYSCM